MLEAPPGFEPGMEVLQTSALPLGYGAGRTWGGRSMRARLHGGAATAWQPSPQPRAKVGAGNGIRTRDFDLGKVALYH
jgi:hypothetical protein